MNIDTQVPLPENKGKLPILELEVGESFQFPSSRRRYVQSYVSLLKKTTGKVFIVRKQDEHFCRVWRAK